MIHIAIGKKHYVATEASIKHSDHNLPAGTLYEIDLAVQAENPLSAMDVLYDIAKAENRQWFRRMLVAGFAAGAAYAAMGYLVSFLPGGGQ